MKLVEYYRTRAYKRPPLVPILIRIIPACISQSYLHNIYFNINPSTPKSS
jgi:hypothetical protein